MLPPLPDPGSGVDDDPLPDGGGGGGGGVDDDPLPDPLPDGGGGDGGGRVLLGCENTFTARRS